jgi:hypothetical protein
MQIREVEMLAAKFAVRLEKNETTYTTIRSFYRDDDAFWGWAKALVSSDEFKYLIFSVRENAIRELVQCTDNSKLMELTGRIQMVQIFAAYLRTGIEQYEAEIQRTKANSKESSAS